MGTTTMVYNDGLQCGGRRPVLWIVYKGTVHTFLGTTIPGVVVVVPTGYEKNGKWSNTTYLLTLAPGAKAKVLIAPLHGRVWEQVSAFEAYYSFAGECPIGFEAWKEAMARDFPKSLARLEEADRLRDELEAQSGDTEEVTLTLSQHCNRNPHPDLQVGETILAHESPVGTTFPEGVVVDTRHSPGYHGGYTTLTVRVKAGTRVQSIEYAKDSCPHLDAVGQKGRAEAWAWWSNPKPTPTSISSPGFNTLAEALKGII